MNTGHFRIIADEISATESVHYSLEIISIQLKLPDNDLCTNQPSIFRFYRSLRRIRRNMARTGISKIRRCPVPFSKPIDNSEQKFRND